MQTISIDIDGVVAKPILPEQLFSRTYKYISNTFHKRTSVHDFEMIIHKILHYPKRVYSNCENALNLLTTNNYQVILNSARPQYLRKVSEIWLKRNNLLGNIDAIHLRTLGKNIIESKYEVIENNNAKIHIDDDPRIIQEISKMDSINKLYFISKNTREYEQFNENPKVVCKGSLYDAVIDILKTDGNY